jgi:hypothetical protein
MMHACCGSPVKASIKIFVSAQLIDWVRFFVVNKKGRLKDNGKAKRLVECHFSEGKTWTFGSRFSP